MKLTSVLFASTVLATAAHADIRPLNEQEKALRLLLVGVPMVIANANNAFDHFTAEQKSSIHGELYVFCADMDGKIYTGQRPGTYVQAISPDLLIAIRKPIGEIQVVNYIANRIGKTEREQKISYVVRITQEYACGVGYYPAPPPADFEE